MESLSAEEHRAEAVKILTGMRPWGDSGKPAALTEAGAMVLVEHLIQAAAQTVLDILEAKERLAKAADADNCTG